MPSSDGVVGFSTRGSLSLRFTRVYEFLHLHSVYAGADAEVRRTAKPLKIRAVEKNEKTQGKIIACNPRCPLGENSRLPPATRGIGVEAPTDTASRLDDRRSAHSPAHLRTVNSSPAHLSKERGCTYQSQFPCTSVSAAMLTPNRPATTLSRRCRSAHLPDNVVVTISITGSSGWDGAIAILATGDSTSPLALPIEPFPLNVDAGTLRLDQHPYMRECLLVSTLLR